MRSGAWMQNFNGNVTDLDIDRFSRNLGKLSFSYMSTTTENVSSIGKKSGEKIHPNVHEECETHYNVDAKVT